MDLLDQRYELREVLGRGGTAEVHRAWDRVLEREVAVKVLLESNPLEGAATARLRFAAESRLLAGLDHPGLVRLLDVGTSHGRAFLVLELVDGGTLADLLAGAPLAPPLVADLGAQVAEALAHAHARGIAHRDVKPGNVLLAADGRAKLADFGIARVVGEDAGVTRVGHTVGTIAYLAPEQVRGEGVGPPVDVYALGLLLLEALTGVRAYPGTSSESAFARLHHGPAIPLSLPTGWPRLLAAMTSADPADRPSAAAAATALRGLAPGRPRTPVTGLSPTVAVATAGPRTRSVRLTPARRRTARWVGAAAAVVVGAVAGIGVLGPDPAVSGEVPSAAAATRVPPASVLSRGATSGDARQVTGTPAGTSAGTPPTEQAGGTGRDGPRRPERAHGSSRDHGASAGKSGSAGNGKAKGHHRGKGHGGAGGRPDKGKGKSKSRG